MRIQQATTMPAAALTDLDTIATNSGSLLTNILTSWDSSKNIALYQDNVVASLSGGGVATSVMNITPAVGKILIGAHLSWTVKFQGSAGGPMDVDYEFGFTDTPATGDIIHKYFLKDLVAGEVGSADFQIFLPFVLGTNYMELESRPGGGTLQFNNSNLSIIAIEMDSPL